MMWLPDGQKSDHYMFSRFDIIPACDKQTDARTDRHLAIAQSALCMASRGKNDCCKSHTTMTVACHRWQYALAIFIATTVRQA